MSDNPTETLVTSHYSSGNFIGTIERVLRDAGIDPTHVTVEQLAPIDNFHTFGHAGTRELAHLAGVTAGQRVLDVGGGVGGPARFLAQEYGCHVTVLDLTEEFCRAGEVLTTWTHLADRVTFVHGNALDTPFPDASFDLVWTQHAAMNIADKPRLYAEVHRVLRPGGRFALFDVLAGPNQPLYFPVPWASDLTYSFLLSPEEVRATVAAAGFAEQAWVTGAELQATLQQAQTQAPTAATSGLSPAVVMGADAEARMANIARNMREGRTTTGMGIFERV